MQCIASFNLVYFSSIVSKIAICMGISMQIGNTTFDTKNHTYIMGILNVTPDSFSDGGKWYGKDMALIHAAEMIKEGAAIIDVGGESTRPGYTFLSEDEEISRILPVIEAIKEEFDIPVSIDTYKSAVATEAIKAGADLINDIWGLQYDDNMAKVIADNDVSCCLMHNRKDKSHRPVDYNQGALYDNFLLDYLADISNIVHVAKEAGIKDDKIILDPGIGFAKSYENNLEAINTLEQLHTFGYPILLGTSRKSFIGLELGLSVRERLEGTIATTVIGIMKGCSFVRVHDIKENDRAIKMTEAILGR